ncbi:MAG: D-tyrosyl-tRNA(Tyr) deacylase [Deltaproteobacteria bacterium]|nr:D-tyrosyl-tRNA(Tyr) deacylase [Deltaproteobacteria bacterium]
MRAVIQRVSSASVSVGGETIASIGKGIVVYLGVEKGDGPKDLDYLAGKVAGLRIFEDTRGAMNLSVLDAGGEALVISQFTLLADCRKGRRPSFTGAMEPGEAEPMYENFARALGDHGVDVETGRFQALMDVESVNQGPVTILLDSRKLF